MPSGSNGTRNSPESGSAATWAYFLDFFGAFIQLFFRRGHDRFECTHQVGGQGRQFVLFGFSLGIVGARGNA